MKITTWTVAACLAGTALSAEFVPVTLEEPLNWLAGSYLFPSQIIAGYNAPVDNYTAENWTAHILSQCKGYTACTSANTFQGTAYTRERERETLPTVE